MGKHNAFYIMVRVQCGKTRNSLSRNKNSSSQLFSNSFSKSTIFTKFLRKVVREFLQFPHSENVLSTYINWFHEKKLAEIRKTNHKMPSLRHKCGTTLAVTERFSRFDFTEINLFFFLCLPVLTSKYLVLFNT